MYGKTKDQNVKLVRMQSWDKRIRRQERIRRRRRQKLLSATAALFTLAAVCVGLFYFHIPANAEEEVVTMTQQELPTVGAEQQQPTYVKEPEVLVMTEPEPKIPLIAIDPGHGGEDEGCSRDGVMEKEINLALAMKLAEQLEAMGFETVLTRQDNDTAVTLEERVRLAEESGADILISIHQNACEENESSVSGIETWYCGQTEGARRLAQLVHAGAIGKTGAKERQLQESSKLYIIRESSIPACLIETAFLSNKKERELICDEEYQDKLVRGIAEGIQYYFNPKTMYLTFDDGPSEKNTTAVLDILKKHNIKATFFVVGENVRKHPEIAKRIVEEGHTIGIHCNCHDYNVIYESVDSYLADFQKAYDTVYEVTGVEVKLFRFPGGSINAYNEDVYEDIIEAMTENGYVYFDWNASLEDAVKKSTPEKLIENAKNSTLGRKKVVMLGHDIQYNTTLCLEELLDSFPEYQMMPLTEDVKPVQFKRK